MVTYAFDTFPRLEIVYDESANKKIESEIVDVFDFIGVKGFRAKGKRVTTSAVKEFKWLDPLPEPEPEPEPEEEPEEETGSEDFFVASEPNDREGFAEGTQTSLF